MHGRPDGWAKFWDGGSVKKRFMLYNATQHRDTPPSEINVWVRVAMVSRVCNGKECHAWLWTLP